jgi:hypothetical protein
METSRSRGEFMDAPFHSSWSCSRVAIPTPHLAQLPVAHGVSGSDERHPSLQYGTTFVAGLGLPVSVQSRQRLTSLQRRERLAMAAFVGDEPREEFFLEIPLFLQRRIVYLRRVRRRSEIPQ